MSHWPNWPWLPTAVFKYDEKWVPLVGYEGSYEISTRGRVRSMPRQVDRPDGRRLFNSNTSAGPKVLRIVQRETHHGPAVRLHRDGIGRQLPIRDLYRETFHV